MAPACYWRGDDLCLRLHLQPRAASDGVTGLHGGRIRLRLKAPAVDGKANASLLKFLAHEFGVRRSDITLLRGETSRSKDICIRSPATLPDWLRETG